MIAEDKNRRDAAFLGGVPHWHPTRRVATPRLHGAIRRYAAMRLLAATQRVGRGARCCGAAGSRVSGKFPRSPMQAARSAMRSVGSWRCSPPPSSRIAAAHCSGALRSLGKKRQGLRSSGFLREQGLRSSGSRVSGKFPRSPMQAARPAMRSVGSRRCFPHHTQAA